MKNILPTTFGLFFAQTILCLWGSTHIFLKEANPFAVIVISIGLTVYCFEVISKAGYLSLDTDASVSPQKSFQATAMPWLYAFVGMIGLFSAYEELRKIWVKFPDPGKSSDVLPQLKGQCELFFTGQFPYQPIVLPTHQPFPVYMPLHWAPIQISHALHIDIRWSGLILLLIAIGVAGYWLRKTHPNASQKHTLTAMLLFAMPVWGFVQWAKIDIALSLESVVATWYLLLAVGLASKNHILITVGIIGALLSRYTLLFWLPLFAALLWLYAPRKYSYWIWGPVTTAVLLLFVVPFWMKDPTILSQMSNHYNMCSDATWKVPDEFTFLDGISLNMHLRNWLPGTAEQNLPYAHYPQMGVQLLLVLFGLYYYRKKWHQTMDIYTFSLVALSIMPILFYSFSPMLFKYYMLTPLYVSAVLCWKTIAVSNKVVLNDPRL